MNCDEALQKLTDHHHETLPADQRVGERMMLGLRLSEGLSLDWLETHLPAADRRRAAIEVVDTQALEHETSLLEEGLLNGSRLGERMLPLDQRQRSLLRRAIGSTIEE